MFLLHLNLRLVLSTALALLSIAQLARFAESLSLEQLASSSFGTSARSSRHRQPGGQREVALRNALEDIRRKRQWRPRHLESVPFKKRQLEEVLDVPLEGFDESPLHPVAYEIATVDNSQIALRSSLARKIQKIIDDIKIAESYSTGSSSSLDLPRKRVLVKRNNKAKRAARKSHKPVRSSHVPKIKQNTKHVTTSSKGHRVAPVVIRQVLAEEKSRKADLNGKRPQSVSKARKATKTAKSTTSKAAAIKPKPVDLLVSKPSHSKLQKTKVEYGKKVNAEVDAILRNAAKNKIKVRKQREADPADLLEEEELLDREVLPDEDVLDEEPVDGPAESDMEPWLRKEFYKNLAKTMAITKHRKRRSSYFDEGIEIKEADESDSDEDQEQNSLVEIEELITKSILDDDEQTEKPSEAPYQQETQDNGVDGEYVFAVRADETGQIPVLEDDTQELEEQEDEEMDGRRKRSIPSFFGKIDYSDPKELAANDDLVKFDDIDTKLRRIEEALLSEALAIIESNPDHNEESIVDEKIANRYEAAYDLEEMRVALDDLRDKIKKMETEKDADDAGDYYEEGSQRKNADKCPALATITSDCYALRDTLAVLIRPEVVEGCNWHEVCYTCGEKFGLQASDCDAGFLEQSRLTCGDSAECESMAKALLAPLQQRRVFYKRQLPGICSANKCIRDYLALIGPFKKR